MLTARSYPDRPIIGVGAVIIREGRAVLVRRAHEPHAGEWSIPGGVVELGETLRAATAREAREETSLIVEPRAVLDIFDRILPDAQGRTQFHYVLVDFLCQKIGGELRAAGDAAEARWVSAAELSAYGLEAAALSVIQKALASQMRGGM